MTGQQFGIAGRLLLPVLTRPGKRGVEIQAPALVSGPDASGSRAGSLT